MRIPVVKSIIYRKLHDKLIAAFGGNLQELILGGAAVSPDVESLLRKIRFPFTVGYGMTECGPSHRLRAMERTARRHLRPHRRPHGDTRRLPDPRNVAGTLWVKGDNVMNGYYKIPQPPKLCSVPTGG